MKIKFFVGLEHQKIHSAFLQEILGGEFVHYPSTVQAGDFSSVLKQDDPQTLWIFNDFYFQLHPQLKGRQIHVGHGLGFKNVFTPERVLAFNQSMDLGFSTGVPNLSYKLRAGFSREKIREIGYWAGFQIPSIPANPHAVLFASAYYQAWNHFQNMRKILSNLSSSLEAHLTLHPETPPEIQKSFRDIARRKKNIIMIETQEELLRSAAICSCAVASAGSVPTLMWFQKKPVFFIRGKMHSSRLMDWMDIGWDKVKKKVQDPLFNEILKRSIKIRQWRQFKPSLVKSAKHVAASEKIFFPWSYDRSEVARRIKSAVQEVMDMGPRS